MNDAPTQRIERKILLGLSENGRLCEVCGRHMHDHEWAILDRQGFAVDCSGAAELAALKQQGK